MQPAELTLHPWRHNSSKVGGVTAGQARHNSSNVGGVTAGHVGHNSSMQTMKKKKLNEYMPHFFKQGDFPSPIIPYINIKSNFLTNNFPSWHSVYWCNPSFKVSTSH